MHDPHQRHERLEEQVEAFSRLRVVCSGASMARKDWAAFSRSLGTSSTKRDR